MSQTRDSRDEPTRLGARTALGVAAAALLVRAISLVVAAARSPYWGGFVVDDRAYHEWALRIARGEGTGEVFFLSPLLSHVLGAVYALVGERPVVWLGVQAVLGALLAATAATVSARAFGRRAGLWTGGLLALYGPLVFVTESVLTEPLHLALAWSAIALWPARGEWRRALAAGLLAGLATLARNYFVLALPLLALGLVRRGRGAVLGFAGGAVLGLLPATLHNLAAGEAVLVTASGGVNLWLGNHPGANGRLHAPPGTTPEAILDPARMDETFRTRAEAEAGRPLSAREVSAHFRDRALDWMRDHPDDFLALVGTRLLLTLEAREFPGERNYDQAARLNPLLRWTPARWPILLALAAAGLLALGRASRAALVPVACAAAAALLALLLFWVTDRFRLVLVPPLAVLAGAGADHLLTAAGRARLAAAGVAVATLALSLGLSWGEPRETSMSHFNLGLQYHRRGEAEKAEAEARAAIELGPENVQAHGLLCESLRAQGRMREARAAWREMARLEREKGIELRRVQPGGR